MEIDMRKNLIVTHGQRSKGQSDGLTGWGRQEVGTVTGGMGWHPPAMEGELLVRSCFGPHTATVMLEETLSTASGVTCQGPRGSAATSQPGARHFPCPA